MRNRNKGQGNWGREHGGYEREGRFEGPAAMNDASRRYGTGGPAYRPRMQEGPYQMNVGQGPGQRRTGGGQDYGQGMSSSYGGSQYGGSRRHGGGSFGDRNPGYERGYGGADPFQQHTGSPAQGRGYGPYESNEQGYDPYAANERGYGPYGTNEQRYGRYGMNDQGYGRFGSNEEHHGPFGLGAESRENDGHQGGRGSMEYEPWSAHAREGQSDPRRHEPSRFGQSGSRSGEHASSQRRGFSEEQRDRGMMGFGSRDRDAMGSGERDQQRYGSSSEQGPIGALKRMFRGPKGYTRSDERIREDVCDALANLQDIDPSDVEVQVRSGEVTLTGTVEMRHFKHRIEDAAENVAGVKDVNNQIRVQPKESSTANANASANANKDLSSVNPSSTVGSSPNVGTQANAHSQATANRARLGGTT